MLRPIRIGITTGDSHGIGPEISARALKKMGPMKGVSFVVWRNRNFPKEGLHFLKKSFRVKTASSWSEAMGYFSNQPKDLIEIVAPTSPAAWVEEAAMGCLFKHLDGMVTAPMAKPTIQAHNHRDLGHTEILKRVTGVSDVLPVFLGKQFHVALVTGHVAVKDIAEKLSEDRVYSSLLSCRELLASLSVGERKKNAPKSIAVLGLNPHAGDDGLIGTEDTHIKKAIDRCSGWPQKVVGPLAADSAFTPNCVSSYSLFLAMYHDQGLIPFKQAHGWKGTQVSWGLPFVRTSPDHGTAENIAGKGIADFTSMQLAIEWAIKLARQA